VNSSRRWELIPCRGPIRGLTAPARQTARNCRAEQYWFRTPFPAPRGLRPRGLRATRTARTVSRRFMAFCRSISLGKPAFHALAHPCPVFFGYPTELGYPTHHNGGPAGVSRCLSLVPTTADYSTTAARPEHFPPTAPSIPRQNDTKPSKEQRRGALSLIAIDARLFK